MPRRSRIGRLTGFHLRASWKRSETRVRSRRPVTLTRKREAGGSGETKAAALVPRVVRVK